MGLMVQILILKVKRFHHLIHILLMVIMMKVEIIILKKRMLRQIRSNQVISIKLFITIKSITIINLIKIQEVFLPKTWLVKTIFTQMMMIFNLVMKWATWKKADHISKKTMIQLWLITLQIITHTRTSTLMIWSIITSYRTITIIIIKNLHRIKIVSM